MNTTQGTIEENIALKFQLAAKEDITFEDGFNPDKTNRFSIIFVKKLQEYNPLNKITANDIVFYPTNGMRGVVVHHLLTHKYSENDKAMYNDFAQQYGTLTVINGNVAYSFLPISTGRYAFIGETDIKHWTDTGFVKEYERDPTVKTLNINVENVRQISTFLKQKLEERLRKQKQEERSVRPFDMSVRTGQWITTPQTQPQHAGKPRKGSYESMTVTELKQRCAKRGIKGYSSLRKADLIAALKTRTASLVRK
jgi:hypothetical protein